MADTALSTAFDVAAPANERNHAMAEAQAAATPTSVPDMAPLVQFMQEQIREQEFQKALSKPNVIPFPSKAVKDGTPGMQSVWLNDSYGNSMGEWRERWSGINFDMLRGMVDQTPILSAVVMTRVRQVQRFMRANSGGTGPGFQIALKDPAAKLGSDEQSTVALLQQFFTNNGWEKNPRQRARLRRDSFSSFMAKSVRDTLTLDSAPIETEYKRDKSLGMDGFYAVDGATIRLATEQGYRDEDEIFALQVVDGNIRAAYTFDDLIYVPRNPRTDVLVGGYGMSEAELLVRTVTGFLNAFTYNNSYFDKNSIPKGMLHLSGNYDQADMASFKRYWNAMVRGINNAWNMPVMVSKDQESKATFENFGVEVNEIMFAKWMTFLTSIICAIYGIAPDEINFESFTAGTSSLSGSDTEEKLVNSKDKGLRPLLSYYEDLFSDYIVSDFGDKYCFRWTGLDEEDPQTRWDKEKTTLTFNEARKARGLEEVKGAWADAPLYQPLIGLYMQEKQAEGEDFGTPDQPGQPGEQGGPGEDGDQGGEQNPPFGKKKPAPGAPGDDDAADDNGPEMQKAFGLEVFQVAP
ncbi:phage portal protein [Tardiphaga sp. 862_B3_N1_1]|uniref:phage portal protein n=1 Tax=Tardiphaga sp. 862_B3_N1_1 TaxID=3240763 RepID=UPI003F8A5774